MDEYLEKLDKYIDMKIEYLNIDMTPLQEIWLRQARAEMEIALLTLIRKN